MNAQAEAASVVHYDVNVWNYREFDDDWGGSYSTNHSPGDDIKPLPCGSPEVGIVYLTDDISAVTCPGCMKALFQS